MHWKNVMTWKKKLKILMTNKSLNYMWNNVILLFEVQKKNPKTVRTKNGRIMLLSKFSVCNSKNRNFLKNKKLKGY